MSALFCSLAVSPDQLIPPTTYTLVKFPYGTAESTDAWGMHQETQPGGAVSAFPDDRSALIWPAIEGLGHLTANIHWEAASAEGPYDELRDQFVRDPLGLLAPPDYTATDHRTPTPGQQFFTKHHELVVRPNVPLGLLVYHNDKAPRRITYAQLKLSIHPLATPPGGQ